MLAQYRLILANSAYGLVGYVSGDIALRFRTITVKCHQTIENENRKT